MSVGRTLSRVEDPQSCALKPRLPHIPRISSPYHHSQVICILCPDIELGVEYVEKEEGNAKPAEVTEEDTTSEATQCTRTLNL